jgi:hypothetical protein
MEQLIRVYLPRTIPVGEKYDSKIYVIDELKKIVKLDCQCGDFIHRRIKKIGEFADTRYFAMPCKHLNPFMERLKRQGYQFTIPKEMTGSDKLTPALRIKLLARANHICECGCERTESLEIHRKTRGSNGGKYNMINCQVLAQGCHDLRHANEFPSGKSK